jgi:hypothetical protein
MKAPIKQQRSLSAIVVSALLLAPGLARAQLDDPGLAPPPPAPAPAPKAAPAPPPPAPAAAPAPKAAPATSPASPASTVPAAALTPPPAATGAEVPVKEETTEDVKVARATNDDWVWEAQLAAPSLNAGIGLLRMLTAETGRAGSFRTAFHVQGFSASELLIQKQPQADGTVIPGDTDARFMGDLAISLSGPDVTFLRHFELYLGIFNSSNQNLSLIHI